jgi:hypothetical protein
MPGPYIAFAANLRLFVDALQLKMQRVDLREAVIAAPTQHQQNQMPVFAVEPLPPSLRRMEKISCRVLMRACWTPWKLVW